MAEYRIQRKVGMSGTQFSVTTEDGKPTVSVEAKEDTVSIIVYYLAAIRPKSHGLALSVEEMDALAQEWLVQRAVPIARKRYEAAKAADIEATQRALDAWEVTRATPEEERERWARYIIADRDANWAVAATERAQKALEALGETVED